MILQLFCLTNHIPHIAIIELITMKDKVDSNHHIKIDSNHQIKIDSYLHNIYI